MIVLGCGHLYVGLIIGGHGWVGEGLMYKRNYLKIDANRTW